MHVIDEHCICLKWADCSWRGLRPQPNAATPQSRPPERERSSESGINAILPPSHRRGLNECQRRFPAGEYLPAVRVPNSLPNGQTLRFANATQDRDVEGWLSLTNVER